MPTVSEKSSHYFDWEKFRVTLKNEKEIRGVYLTRIAEVTGVHVSQITRFLNNEAETLGVDLTVSLVKWLGVKVEDFIIVRNAAKKHTDTPEQRQLRMAQKFLERNGIDRDGKETAVETMMRLLAEARAKGLLDE
jgi:hypothetical protein